MKYTLPPIIQTAMLLAILLISQSCQREFEEGSFGADLEVLKQLNDLQVLSSGKAMIAVSAKLQGRVFTSTAKGLQGKSYGWFKRKAILDNAYQNQYGGLGGEDRMWFGPQFGRYSVFHEPGQELDRIPPALNAVDFKVIHQTDQEVKSIGQMQIRNLQNYTFHLEAERKISILAEQEIETRLEINIPEGVSYVGFETNTRLKNIGQEAWSKQQGLLSIWILGTFLPTDHTVAMIPTRGSIDSVTNYFTPLDDSRVQIKNGIVYYNADANYLNKIGILPEHTVPIFGSYSPEINLLTIVQFTFEDAPLYVNSQDIDQINPHGGDVINIFNDGVTPMAGPFGPFYELESSSAAKELQIGEILAHTSTTYHFEGSEAQLDDIAQSIFGVSLTRRVKF